jgi:hypothetical protein
MTRISFVRGLAICGWLVALAQIALVQEPVAPTQPESGPDLRTRVEAQLRSDAALRVEAPGAERALERALALIALGIARHAPARELLESQARYGPGNERLAAIAALGDLGSPDPALFAELVRDPDPNVRGMACLALGHGGAGPRVGEIAVAASVEIAATARAAIDFAREPREHLDFLPGLLRLGLRARGAAIYAPAPEAPKAPAPAVLEPAASSSAAPNPESPASNPPVGPAKAAAPGATSPAPTMALATPAPRAPAVGPAAFEFSAMLSIAADLDRPAIRDHLLELLLDGGSPEVAAATVRVLPEQVAQLMLTDLWRPSSPAHWSALVDAIDRGLLEKRAIDVLRLSLGQEAERERAAALLLAAGVGEARETLAGGDSGPQVGQRFLLAMALGRSRDKNWIGELSGLALDADPVVRAAAVLAQARLGHGPANARLRDQLKSKPSGAAAQSVALDPAALAEVLWRLGFDPHWQPWLQDQYAVATGRDRLRLAVRLAQHGRLAQREELRTALAQHAAQPLEEALLAELVTALALAPNARDLELLESLASARSTQTAGTAAARRIDAELLAVLVRSKHPRGLAILRDALWRSPRPLACIAALQWIESAGLAELENELDLAPARTTVPELRRAGFAYGRFCGWPALDRLARRKRADDPLLQGAWLGALSARSL